MNRRVGRDAIDRVKAHRESRGTRWASRRRASFNTTVQHSEAIHAEVNKRFPPRLATSRCPTSPGDLRRVAHLDTAAQGSAQAGDWSSRWLCRPEGVARLASSTS
jgi:hypothetical protein